MEDILHKLKIDEAKTVEELKKWLHTAETELETAFEHMKKKGKDEIEAIVKWMKDAKILVTKEAEALVRDHLGKDKLTFKHFKDLIIKMAHQQGPSDLVATVKQHDHKLVAAFKEAHKDAKDKSGTSKK